MKLIKKMARVGRECVACGCCASVCPRDAIQILYGIAAQVDASRCVGCGRCAKTCPAGVIEMIEWSNEE